MAALTAGGIILCQFYWVYYNYKTARTNFVQTANYALRNSLDRYQLSQNTLPTSLKHRQPSFTFFMRTIPAQDHIALDTPNSKRRFTAEFTTVSVDSNQLPEVKALVARLLSQQKHKAIHLDTLNSIFQHELARSNINEKFRLAVQRNNNFLRPEKIGAVVNFYKDPMTVTAELQTPRAFFFRNNFVPALVSSLLIILSAGCLFYMGRIIKRQMLLDTMKTDFINNITHELRTPITILKSSNEALAKFGAAEEVESLNRHLTINANVLDDLESSVERILKFSQSEQDKLSANYEMVDLAVLINEVTERFSLMDQAKIKANLQPVDFAVLSDRYMLEVILTNLLDNAIKYSPGGANIMISASMSASKWTLEISDRGLGIEKSKLPYIFDKFYRVDTGDVQDVKGYGIGLAYVKQLLKALQAKIDVVSHFGHGTTFILTFDVWTNK